MTTASGRAESFVTIKSPTVAPTRAIRHRVGETTNRNAKKVRRAPRRLLRLSLVTNAERKRNLGMNAMSEAATTGVHLSVVMIRAARKVNQTVVAPMRTLRIRSRINKLSGAARKAGLESEAEHRPAAASQPK